MNNFYTQLNSVAVAKITQCIKDNPTNFEQLLLNDSNYSDCKNFILEIKRRSSYYVKLFKLEFKDIAVLIMSGAKIPMGKCKNNLR